MMAFPQCPASVKQIQPYLKIAEEHDTRDVVVAYWARLYALQVGLKLSTHHPDETELFMALMNWLEKTKKEHADNEAITAEVAAQAHLENYALKLFLFADKLDRASDYGRKVVKAFFSSGILYDMLQTYGELTEEAQKNRKYAKWKATYIHNCLKKGEVPVPGPAQHDYEDDEVEGEGEGDSEENANLPSTSKGAAAFAADANDDKGDDDNGSVDKPASIDRSPPISTPPTADEVLQNPDKLPSPPVDEEKPGGFEPYDASAQPCAVVNPTPAADLHLTPEQMLKAQKFCKYAGSALNYDDVPTAIDYLQKTLLLLTLGQDP